MKIATFLIAALLSHSLLADEPLYEIESQLVINGEPLEKQIFTAHMFQNEYRIFEDKDGKPYKVHYQLQLTEEGLLNLFTKVSTYVFIADFVLHDDEDASLIAKPASPEYEVAVKVKKLPAPDIDTRKKNEADKK